MPGIPPPDGGGLIQKVSFTEHRRMVCQEKLDLRRIIGEDGQTQRATAVRCKIGQVLVQGS
jgi:hypothetical protein